MTHVSSSHSGCSITSDSGSSSLSDIYQVRLEGMLMGGAIASSFAFSSWMPLLLPIVSFCLKKYSIDFKKLLFVWIVTTSGFWCVGLEPTHQMWNLFSGGKKQICHEQPVLACLEGHISISPPCRNLMPTSAVLSLLAILRKVGRLTWCRFLKLYFWGGFFL